MKKLVQNLKHNAFLRNNLIYWTGSLGVSFLNYLFHPILGRLMMPADFGEVQTIISIFTQIGVFLQVLGLVSIGIIAKYQDESIRDQIISELSRLSLFLSVAIFILSVFFTPLLVNFFHFSSVTPFIALGLSLLISVPGSFATSYLQAHHRFGILTAGNFIGSVAKLGFSVLFVLLGFKAFGAIMGLAVAQTIVLLYALSKGKGIIHFIESNLHLTRPKLGLIKPELPYAAMVFAASLTTNLLLSLDILVIKHYFPPQQAGLYTGISIISNIIYFVTGPIAMVLMPSIKPNQSDRLNRQLLWRSLGFCSLIGGAALIAFAGAPKLVVSILLGSRYVPYASFLPRLSLALFLLSLANLVIYYNVALRRYLVAPIVLAGLAVTLWLLSQSHATLGAVVNDLLLGAIALVILLILHTAIPPRRVAT